MVDSGTTRCNYRNGQAHSPVHTDQNTDSSVQKGSLAPAPGLGGTRARGLTRTRLAAYDSSSWASALPDATQLVIPRPMYAPLQEIFMKLRSLLFCLIAVVALAASCAPVEDTGESATGDAAMADAASSDDALSGTWSGDWGPTPEHRNAVTLELSWDGTNLSGTVNPGPDGIELTDASFDPATGNVMMHASATNFRGEEVHYMIEGQLSGGSMTGSWNHDTTQGDFAITRD